MGGQVTRTALDGRTLHCHPLKASMCPQLPAFLPLCFHANTKGSQIVMDKTQRSVRRIASFCNAITFTNRPIRINEQVRLKITKKQGCWSGALRVGFSTVDPSDLSSAWLPRFACPDLVNETGFWARALPEEQCEEGTILSFWLDNTGQVFYRVNGGSPIFFFIGVPTGEPVWAIIDIYGLTREVQLLGTSCGYTPSCSEIQRSIFSDVSHHSANQRHSTAVRGFTDIFQLHPQSISSSAGTTFSSLSSESSSSCYAITDEECLICCERTVDSVLYTCGHMCVCSVCGGKLTEMSNPSCPMCRSPIRDIIKIYRSL